MPPHPSQENAPGPYAGERLTLTASWRNLCLFEGSLSQTIKRISTIDAYKPKPKTPWLGHTRRILTRLGNEVSTLVFTQLLPLITELTGSDEKSSIAAFSEAGIPRNERARVAKKLVTALTIAYNEGFSKPSDPSFSFPLPGFPPGTLSLPPNSDAEEFFNWHTLASAANALDVAEFFNSFPNSDTLPHPILSIEDARENLLVAQADAGDTFSPSLSPPAWRPSITTNHDVSPTLPPNEAGTNTGPTINGSAPVRDTNSNTLPVLQAISNLADNLEAHHKTFASAIADSNEAVTQLSSRMDNMDETLATIKRTYSEQSTTSTATPNTKEHLPPDKKRKMQIAIKQQISEARSTFTDKHGNIDPETFSNSGFVSSKYYLKVWKREFIHLKKLLNDTKGITRKKPKKKLKASASGIFLDDDDDDDDTEAITIMDPNDWYQAIDLLINLYTSSDKPNADDYRRYRSNLLRLAVTRGNATAQRYDIHWRRFAASVEKLSEDFDEDLEQPLVIKWCRISDFILQQAISAKSSSNTKSPDNPALTDEQRKRKNGKKFCFGYNATDGNTCTDKLCEFKHTCQLCDKKHPKSTCSLFLKKSSSASSTVEMRAP